MGSAGLAETGLAVLVRISCGALTMIVAEAVKLAGVLLVAVTVAVLTSAPLKPAAVVPVTTKVTLAPGAKVPRLSVRVLLLSVATGVPVTVLVVTTLVQVTPEGAGSGSVKLTPK